MQKKSHGPGASYPPDPDEKNFRFFLVPDDLVRTGTCCVACGVGALKNVLKYGIDSNDAKILRFIDVDDAIGMATKAR